MAINLHENEEVVPTELSTVQQDAADVVNKLRDLVAFYPAEVQQQIIAAISMQPDAQASIEVAQEIIEQIEIIQQNPDANVRQTVLRSETISQIREQEVIRRESTGQASEMLLNAADLTSQHEADRRGDRRAHDGFAYKNYGNGVDDRQLTLALADGHGLGGFGITREQSIGLNA